MSKEPWDDYFMRMAELVASRSDDIHTKVGTVLVGPDKEIRSTGYNGFPRKVLAYSYRLERPTKYLYMSHSEVAAIGNAALHGASTKGCTAYVTHRPCFSCAQLLIQSGIAKVYYCDGEVKSDSPDAEAAVMEMFAEAGVELILVNMPLTR